MGDVLIRHIGWCGRGEEGEPPVFSKAEPSPFLSVGGVDGDCGFFGHIAEVRQIHKCLKDRL